MELARQNERDQFHHTPLQEERSIRLLRILPDRDDFDALRDSDSIDIFIKLETFPFDQPLEYEALSYTWGKASYDEGEDESTNNPGISHRIMINSQTFIITENLYDGLLELRNDVEGYLWVDAICIDQKNDQERASQVMLMGEIYSKARGVIVWLGREIPEVETVLWLSRHFLDALDASRKNVNVTEIAQFLGKSQREFDKLWRYHYRFYRHYRYFRRGWIIQEFILAQTDPVVRCGDKTLSWWALIDVIKSAIKLGIAVGQDAVMWFEIAVMRHPDFMRNGVISEQQLEFHTATTEARTVEQLWYANLIYLAEMLRTEQVSCLHDHIYAFFGVAERSLPSSIRHPYPLTVDYSQPIENLFLSFATRVLRNLPTLALLSFSHGLGIGDRKYPKLPSWCPDYSISKHNTTEMIFTRSTASHSGIPVFEASLSLARDSTPCQVDGHVLHVTGKRVAKVSEACQATSGMFPTTGIMRNLPGIEGIFEACLKMDPIYAVTGQDRFEVLWRTLLLDYDDSLEQPTKYPESELISPLFQAYLTFFCSVPLAILDNDKKLKYLELLTRWEKIVQLSSINFPFVSRIFAGLDKIGLESNKGVMDKLLELPCYEHAIKFMSRASHTNQRRLFITTQKWFGLGPENLRPDDEVWLLKHAKVPFILRPYGDQYQLVGEAYVHGIMFGELVTGPGGEEGFQDIEIV